MVHSNQIEVLQLDLDLQSSQNAFGIKFQQHKISHQRQTRSKISKKRRIQGNLPWPAPPHPHPFPSISMFSSLLHVTNTASYSPGFLLQLGLGVDSPLEFGQRSMTFWVILGPEIDRFILTTKKQFRI